MSNASVTYPFMGDNPGKLGLIPHDVAGPHGPATKGGDPFTGLPVREGSMSYQLVGGVTAHQGDDG